MIDNNEMRRRRVERLAMLEAQARNSSSSSEQSSNSPTPREELPPQSQPPKKQEAAPVPAPKKEEAPKPAARKLPSQPTLRQSATSVSFIFQLPESEVPKDWPGALELGIDSILWDRITTENVKPLAYLQGVYNRSERLIGDLQGVAQQVQEAVVTMAFISASADKDDEVYDDVGQSLFNASISGNLNKPFVHKLLGAASDDHETFLFLLNGIVWTIVRSLEYGSPNTSAAFHLLETLIEVPGAPELMLEIPKPPHSPAVIARKTLLGALFGLGVSPEGLMRLHSAELISSSSLSELAELAKQTEPMTQLLDECQFRFVEKLVRRGATTRKLVLQWFGAVLDANHGQMAMNRIPGKTNTLQLMVNALKVLLRLADPFVRLDSLSLMQQLGKIDPEYFANKVSYDVHDETKVLASQDAPFNSRSKETPLKFVTECFFLCAGFLHFGLHATVQALDGFFKRQVSHLESQIEGMSSDPNIQRLPPALQRLTVTRFTGLLRTMKCEYAGLHAVIHNPEFMGQVLRFAEFNLAFDVYAAEKCPARLEIRVPWDESPPEAYSSFPEFLVDAPLAAASFVLKSVEFLKNPSMSVDNQLLVDAAIFYMSSPTVLRNPYLRSKFVEILYFGGADIPLTSGSSVPGTLSSLFTTSDTCRKFLLPALMSVFIDIEHTGRTSQFYEKFTTRELVANVLKVIWRDMHYRNQLVTESKEKPEFFVKFVALLLNDATYLLDEALGKLLEVHKLQHDPNSLTPNASRGGSRRTSPGPEEGNDNDDGGREERGEEEEEDDELATGTDPASRLRSAERAAQNFLQLSTSTMTLLNTFTSTVPSIFATPEIIDRFTVMLNYNLAALVGPRCNQLKVQNPAELGFNPRQLLSDLVKVYLNLREEKSFPKSLSKDERSYRDENFSKATRLLSKFSLLSPIDLENFVDLAKRTHEAWKETQEEEEEFGDDVPDEYLDPLMFDIMNDPVTLPTSRVNIDLSTIKTHLLSDPTDPFNRVPLKIEDVIPNPELKREIEEFKRHKKEQGKLAKKQMEANNDMDTS